MEKCLIFSDLHFYRHRQSNLFISIATDILNRIVSVVEKSGIKHVWFLGDWFNEKNKIGAEELVITSKFLSKMSDIGVSLVLVPGNHDMVVVNDEECNGIQFFAIANNVTVVKKYHNIRFGEKSYHFFGYNVKTKEEIFNLMKDNAGTYNYFLGHVEVLSSSACQMASKPKSDIDEKFLSENFKMSFLGHYHKPMDSGNIVYVGSPYQQNFGECNNKNRILVYDIDSDEVTNLVNKTSPKFVKVMSSMLNDDVISGIRNSFVRIILDKTIDSTRLSDIRERLAANNRSVEVIFEYDDDKYGDPEYTGIKQMDDIRKKLFVVDMGNAQNLKDLFKSYIDSYPDEIDRECLYKIIDEISIT